MTDPTKIHAGEWRYVSRGESGRHEGPAEVMTAPESVEGHEGNHIYWRVQMKAPGGRTYAMSIKRVGGKVAAALVRECRRERLVGRINRMQPRLVAFVEADGDAFSEDELRFMLRGFSRALGVEPAEEA